MTRDRDNSASKTDLDDWDYEVCVLAYGTECSRILSAAVNLGESRMIPHLCSGLQVI